MARFPITVGFICLVEKSRGKFMEENIERTYDGDYTRNSAKWQSGTGPNDDISSSLEIGFVMDGFAFENFYSIRYVVYRGIKWKVTGFENKFPKLILSIGGVYNGESD